MRNLLFIGCFFLSLTRPLFSENLPAGCQYSKPCIIEVPEAICADGSTSYVQLFIQKQSPSLVIYLEPGGACWNDKTCTSGYVLKLSRPKPKSDPYRGERGLLDLKNPRSPLFQFSQATIPYCTGDVFLGNHVMEYGKTFQKKIIRHKGYPNVLHSLEVIQSVFPDPHRVVLLGRSAGGLGVLGHAKNLDKAFPKSAKYIISDAGTPLMPPFVDEDSYQEIISHWNTKETLFASGVPGINHFGDLLRFNQSQFPHIRFGLVQSYQDSVMRYFANAIGSPDPKAAVELSSLTAWKEFMGENSSQGKVFFLKGSAHINTRKPLHETQSLGVTLLDWFQLMLEGSPLWESVVP